MFQLKTVMPGVIVFLLFFLLLLGDTQVRWTLTALSLILLFGTSGWHSVQSKVTTRLLFLLIAWILSLCGSLFFTHSLPLSLEELPVLVMPFLFFWWIVSVFHTKDSNKETVFLGSLLTVYILLTVFHVVVQYFPYIGSSLPSISLLYAHYGHAHIAALHVLLYPLLWWFVTVQQQNNRRWMVLIPLVLFSVILSSSRVAIFLLFLQQIALVLPELRPKKNQVQNRWNTVVGGMILGGITLVGAVFLVGSLSKVSYSHPLCTATGNTFRVCKSFATETRPEYFAQAIRGIKEFSLFGYGPGTFMLISERYKELPHTTSTYAHNVFLQRLSEDGIVAGFFYIAIMFLITFAMVKHIVTSYKKKNGVTAITAAAIGWCGFVVTGLLDFDWHLFGLVSVAFVLAGFVLACTAPPNAKQQKKTWKAKVLWLVVYSLGLIMAALSVWKIQFSFRIVSFSSPFYYQRDFNDVSQQKWYWNHPEYLEYQLQRTVDPQVRAEVLTQQFLVQPWSILNNRASTEYSIAAEYERAVQQLTAETEFILNKEAETEFVFEATFKENLSSEWLQLIQYQQNSLDADALIEYVSYAVSLHPWILTTPRADFLFDGSVSGKKTLSLYPLLLERPDLLGFRYTSVQAEYMRVFQSVLGTLDISEDEAMMFIEYWHEIDPVRLQRFSEKNDEKLYNMLIAAAAAKDGEAISEVLAQWHSLNTVDSLYPDNDYVSNAVYASALVTAGTELAESQPELTIEYYQAAAHVDYTVFAEQKLWFERVPYNALPTDSLLSYVHAYLQKPDFKARLDVHVPLLVYVASNTNRSESEIIDFLKHLQTLSPSGYWEYPLLGHWYLSQGQFEEAMALYQECLARQTDHFVCKEALESAEERRTTDEYWKRGVLELVKQ